MKMVWKFLVVALVAAVLMIAPLSVLAAPEPKSEVVTITAGASVDSDSVDLVATTLKHDSAYIDIWAGATKVSTILNSNGYYVSTATFSAESLAEGDYCVTYHITMTSGKSSVEWTGSASIWLIVTLDSEGRKLISDPEGRKLNKGGGIGGML